MTTARHESGFTLVETLIVVGLIGVVGAIAVPMMGNTIRDFRVNGDARSVANSLAVAKMRAASNFSRTRLYVDVSGAAYHLESLDKSATPPHWTPEGGTTYLSSGVTFSWGVVLTPPPNTQTTIGQASPCTTDTYAAISGTACVIFNSRGVPVDSTASPAPTADDAVYLTDGTGVYGMTVAATGMVRSWRTQPTSTPAWVLR